MTVNVVSIQKSTLEYRFYWIPFADYHIVGIELHHLFAWLPREVPWDKMRLFIRNSILNRVPNPVQYQGFFLGQKF
jgi:hypothetical protein